MKRNLFIYTIAYCKSRKWISVRFFITTGLHFAGGEQLGCRCRPVSNRVCVVWEWSDSGSSKGIVEKSGTISNIFGNRKIWCL